MRLTLRNLLRFLDQSELRSMERARLEQLVDESETADAWIKRIDSLRHNISTPVPALDEEPELLPDVVSYLDGTMSEEATSDFERSLMGSDSRLAEVASCHEIRESILSDGTVAVPLLLRQSIYDLGREVNYDLAVRAREAKQAALDSDDNEDENLDVDEETEVAQMAANMQDLPYVDASPDEPEPLLGFSNEPDEADDDDDVVSLDQLQNKAARKSSIRVMALMAGALLLIGATFAIGWYAGSLPKNLGVDEGLAKNTVNDPTKNKETKDDSDVKIGDADTDPIAPDGSPDERPDGDGEGNTTANGVNAVAGDVQPVPPPPPLEVPEDPNTLPKHPELIVLDLANPDANGAEAGADPVLLTVASVSSFGKRALVYSNDDSKWKFQSPDVGITEQAKLRVLAGDRVELDFGGNLSVMITGPAAVEIGMRDVASQSDVLKVSYGKVTVDSRQADVDFWFERDDRQYRLTFPEQGSMLDADFTRYRQPGADPRESALASIDRMQLVKGRVNVDDRNTVHTLSSGQGIAQSFSDDEGLTRPLIKGNLSAIQPLSRSIERLKEVVDDNPEMLSIPDDAFLTEHLVQMKSDRRQERRFAAVAWMAEMGNYDHLLDFLNESSNRGNWSKVTESVRNSIQDDPENAKRLFDAFEMAGENRELLYQSVLGMSPESLEASGDEKLVEWLTNDELAVRVLAIEAIKLITEGRSYGYVPYAESKNRKRVVQRQWSKVLRKKELRYPVAPQMPFPTILEEAAGGEAPDSSKTEAFGGQTDSDPSTDADLEKGSAGKAADQESEEGGIL